MRHRVTAIVCATATLVGACAAGGTDPGREGASPDTTRSDGRTGSPTPRGRWTGRALTPFSGCDDLTAWLGDQAAERVGPYGLSGMDPWGGGPMFADDRAVDEAVLAPIVGDGDVPAAGVPATVAPTATEHSTTNVQEAGIDEPDVVKTDGERLVAVVDGVLRVVDVTADEPALLGSLALPSGWGHELLLAGDRAFVLSHGGTTPEVLRSAGVDDDELTDPATVPGGETTVLQEIDLSTPARPTVTTTQVIEGRYLTARVVDGTARVVVTSPPAGLDLVTPTGPGAEAYAEETNRRILADLDATAWLPDVTTVDGQGRAVTEPLVSCADVAHPDTFSGFGTLTVASIDLDQPLDVTDAVSVLADGETVYASAGSLYVATNEWVDPVVLGPVAEAEADGDWERAEDLRAELEDADPTTIHRFDIGEPGPAAYVGSGTVPGHLLSQFALSEHEGVLRVATTAGSPWGAGDTSESLVTTLALDRQELVELGQVGDMGRGEQIYAVRFIGDRGYVVTFRQTDPLYVLDLADPADPRVTGELEMPGYSAYLHPVGDDLLLGVGQDGTDDGRLTGAAVSLFDVSDPADPRRVDHLNLGSGSSDVEWDHRAFLWWAPDALALLPLQTWDAGSPRSGAVGLDVSADGLTERGDLAAPADAGICGAPVPQPLDELSVEDLAVAVGETVPTEACSFADPGVLRTVVVGDTVLTLGSAGLGAYALTDLTPVAWTSWGA